MRTLIAIPCMDQMDTSFVQSLMYLRRTAEDGIMFSASSLIYDSRNKLADVAAKNNAEYILWLDSDMTFEPDLLERLFKDIQGKDFVSGMYFKRRPNYEPCIFKKAGYRRGKAANAVVPYAEEYKNYPKKSLFEIEGCGFGCVLMRTEMCKKIQEECGLPFAPVAGFGEDISFCIKARECGYKLYCDSSIQCGHTAHIIVNENTFVSWGKGNVRRS